MRVHSRRDPSAWTGDTSRGRGLPDERLGKRKRRVRSVSFSVGACIGLALFVWISWYSYQEEMRVTQIRIEGNSTLDAGLLERATQQALGGSGFQPLSPSSIAFYSTSAIRARLVADFPRIRAVNVRIASLSERAITVKIEERSPVAHVCMQGPCYAVDDGGYIFARGDEVSLEGSLEISGIPIATENPLRSHVVPTHYATMIQTAHLLSEAGAPSTRIVMVNADEYQIERADGIRFLMRFEQSPLVLAEYAKIALASETVRTQRQKLEYVDLRFGTRVYYKLRE